MLEHQLQQQQQEQLLILRSINYLEYKPGTWQLDTIINNTLLLIVRVVLVEPTSHEHRVPGTYSLNYRKNTVSPKNKKRYERTSCVRVVQPKYLVML